MSEDEKSQESGASLSELDDQLAADKDGSFKQSILDKLKPYRENLDSKMAKGELAPDEFEVAKALSEAIKQAEAVVSDR